MTISPAPPVQAGTAFASHDRTPEGERCTIGSDLARLVLEIDEGGRLSVAQVGDLPGDAVRGSERVFVIEPVEVMTVRAVETNAGADRVTLTLSLEGDGGAVRLVLEAISGSAVIRQWLEVRPTHTMAIARCIPLQIIASDPAAELHHVAGVQRQGGWSPESGPYRSFRHEWSALSAAGPLISGERSTWDESPWAAVATGGQHLVVAFDYGGQWQLEVTHAEGGTVLGFHTLGIVPEVVPGATWISPATWIGAVPGDLDAAARAWVRHLRESVIPAAPDGMPWLQYNTWYAWACDLDEAALLTEAEHAAALGCEVFYIDAGWWTGNPMRGGNFGSGLGNWTENRDKFPAGIAAFADEIRALGMEFGIWVEPERVDLRTATTGTWNPAWIATSNGEFLGPEWPADTQTAWLCYGHTDVQDWAIEWIGEMVERFGVRWLKWDSNYWGICTSPDHGHAVGDAEAAQLAGVYRVMDALRERFPDLVIENCAGGGTRMDFAIARHSHTWWVSDASDPSQRVRAHASGGGYLFPLETLNAWVTESISENMRQQELPEPVIRALVRSRMIGAMGVSCQLAQWSAATRAIVASEIATYKEIVRPLVREGYLAHLLPQPDLAAPRLAPAPAWEAFQVHDAGGTGAAVLGFRNLAVADRQRVVIRQLQPGRSYTVKDLDGGATNATGAELMSTGVELACAPLTSVLLAISADPA
jgi:alpha-galactosidase